MAIHHPEGEGAGPAAEKPPLYKRRGFIIGAGSLVGIGLVGIAAYRWSRPGETPAQTPAVKPTEGPKPAEAPKPAAPAASPAPVEASKPAEAAKPAAAVAKSEAAKPAEKPSEIPSSVADTVVKNVNRVLRPAALRNTFVNAGSGEARVALNNTLQRSTAKSRNPDNQALNQSFSDRPQFVTSLKGSLPKLDLAQDPFVRIDFNDKEAAKIDRVVFAGQLPGKEISPKVTSMVVEEKREAGVVTAISRGELEAKMPVAGAEAFDLNGFLKAGYRQKVSDDRWVLEGTQSSDGSDVKIFMSRDLRFVVVIDRGYKLRPGEKPITDVFAYPTSDKPAVSPAVKPQGR